MTRETTTRPEEKMGAKANSTYMTIVGVVFTLLTIVFLFMPRSAYSELEKRDLAQFPEISEFKSDPAAYTAAVSQWFSDSEPYRDQFMTMSMEIRDAMGYLPGNSEEAISYKPMSSGNTEQEGVDAGIVTEAAEGNPLANENAKIATSATIVVGKGENVRALMVFGGSAKSGKSYAEMLNYYADQLPGVHIYALVAPLATEYYLPDKAKNASKPQKPMVEGVRDMLSSKVKYVDVYNALAAHTTEDIYLRTDHHWAPLGAYYAARQIARTAGVPFKELSSYDRHVVKGFVGSMYGYTKDISVKRAPEDFVYYTPRGLNYKTTFITYNINSKYQVTSASKPYSGAFFKHFKDGSGAAYSTFMGGDRHTVKVETGMPGNRRLLIIKDSYGNALPGYMFYSFNEVHVVDFRYFTMNMREYIRTNRITDVVIAFNVFNACSSSAAEKVKRFLSQRSGEYSPQTQEVAKDDTSTKSEEPRHKEDSATAKPAETKSGTKSETKSEVHPTEPAAEPTEPVKEQPTEE